MRNTISNVARCLNKADIEMDKMICEMEGYNFTEYLDSLQAVVLSYYGSVYVAALCCACGKADIYTVLAQSFLFKIKSK